MVREGGGDDPYFITRSGETIAFNCFFASITVTKAILHRAHFCQKTPKNGGTACWSAPKEKENVLGKKECRKGSLWRSLRKSEKTASKKMTLI